MRRLFFFHTTAIVLHMEIVEIWSLKRGPINPPQSLPAEHQAVLIPQWKKADKEMTLREWELLYVARTQKWEDD
jgi:hypothetical protein